MPSYKDIIYRNYVSSFNSGLYGVNTLAKITTQFPSWQFYYRDLLPLGKDCAILDLGCGDGNFLYWLQTLGYTNTIGIDVSLEQVEHGKKMGIANLQHADIFQFLTANVDKYDIIIARDVIEHFTKDEVFTILGLINSSLRKSGVFLMQVPNGQGMHYTNIFYGDYTHEMAYTDRSVAQIANNTGFTQSTCVEMGPAPVGIVSTIRYVLWKYKVCMLKFWQMVETGNATGIFTQNLIAILKK